MNTAASNPLPYINFLQQHGVPEAQAEAFVEVIASMGERGANVPLTRADLKSELDLFAAGLVLKFGCLMVALASVLIAIIYLG